MPLSPELQSALDAARAGDRATARKILKGILRENQDDENAWLLYSQVAEKPEQVIASLENVLRINPYNARAQTMLEQARPKEEPKEDPNKPWDYDRFQQKQRQSRPAAEEGKKPNPRLKLFIGIGIGLVLVVLLGVGGFMAARSLGVPKPTQTTPIVYSSPTPTPDTCTCSNAREYLLRTTARFDALANEADIIDAGVTNNTLQMADVSALVAAAELHYNEQRAETPPACLEPFQKKVVQVFWGWHQAMLSLQNGDVNAAVAFMNNFVTDIAAIDAEMAKLAGKLDGCFAPIPTPEGQGSG